MLFNITCPSCRREGVKVNFHRHEIKYFGEVMESVIQCDCGYRHVDVLILGEKEPVRYRIRIEDEEDMNARVVRSGSSTIEIPELGVKVTPGVASEGYITNIEGVLTRIEDVLVSLRDWEGKKTKAEELLNRVAGIKRGEEAVHMIIEDPSGNSAIISDKAVKEALR
jgi:zinc finger protein